MYTLSNLKEIVRAEHNEFNDAKLYDKYMTVQANRAQKKVYKKILEINPEAFKKTAFNSGNVFQLPTDILPVINAIISVKASAATAKASVSTAYSRSNNDLTFKAVEPGDRTIKVRLRDSSDITTPYTPIVDSATVLPTEIIILVYISSGNSTASQIKTAMEASVISKKYVDTSFATGNDGSGIVTLSAPLNGDTHTLANGSGTGWVHAERIFKPEEWNSMEQYLLTRKPNESNPKYFVNGDVNKKALINFKPETITFSMLEYLYMISDMADDDSELSIGELYQELVLLEFMMMCKNKLGTDTTAAKADYDEELARIKAIAINSSVTEQNEDLKNKTD